MWGWQGWQDGWGVMGRGCLPHNHASSAPRLGEEPWCSQGLASARAVDWKSGVEGRGWSLPLPFTASQYFIFHLTAPFGSHWGVFAELLDPHNARPSNGALCALSPPALPSTHSAWCIRKSSGSVERKWVCACALPFPP